MGAWGHGSFENDDAADWVSDFEANGVSAVVSVLEHVTQLGEDEYLEAPEASMAVAAAEMVAAARDGDLSALPSDNERKALSRHQAALRDPQLVALARQAVERVLQQSELKDLWSESGTPDPSWLNVMGTLSSRLR
jgi:hypothetical protein